MALATIDEVIYQEYGSIVVEPGDGLRFGLDWDQARSQVSQGHLSMHHACYQEEDFQHQVSIVDNQTIGAWSAGR